MQLCSRRKPTLQPQTPRRPAFTFTRGTGWGQPLRLPAPHGVPQTPQDFAPFPTPLTAQFSPSAKGTAPLTRSPFPKPTHPRQDEVPGVLWGRPPLPHPTADPRGPSHGGPRPLNVTAAPKMAAAAALPSALSPAGGEGELTRPACRGRERARVAARRAESMVAAAAEGWG